MSDNAQLRAEFVRLLTTDGPTTDRRRKGYNQAIFDAERGWAVFTRTDLHMVLDKFDAAVAAAEPCQHLSATGDEGPVAALGSRHVVRWRCDGCGVVHYSDEALAAVRSEHRTALAPPTEPTGETK